jgi:hypothetical protein
MSEPYVLQIPSPPQAIPSIFIFILADRIPIDKIRDEENLPWQIQPQGRKREYCQRIVTITEIP